MIVKRERDDKGGRELAQEKIKLQEIMMGRVTVGKFCIMVLKFLQSSKEL